MAEVRRFDHVTKDELSKRTEQLVPSATRKKVNWALNMFKSFQEDSIKRQSEEGGENGRTIVYKTLSEMNFEELNYELKYFFLSLRRMDGNRYPPKSIYDIMTMINFHLNNDLKHQVNLFTDSRFNDSIKSMNTAMKESAEAGNVSGERSSRPISIDDENKLWEAGVLSWNNPKQTLNTAVFLLSIHTSVRGGKELRSWRYGDDGPFRLDSRLGKEVLLYNESKNKTYQGTARSMRLEPPKECVIHHNDSNHVRCAVCAYKTLVSGRPLQCSKTALFLKPLAKKQGTVIFADQVVGEHMLANIMSTIMAGIPGRFTNHSARKSAPTRMYQGKIEEQIIQEQTRHRSLLVRKYKETNEEQLIEKSAAIYGNKSDTVEISSGENSKTKMAVEIDGENKKVKITFF